MSNKRITQSEHDQSVIYQIRIKGQLDSQWIEWFEGLTITLEDDGTTLLAGPVADQAALHGILKRVRDLGLPLLSILSEKSTNPLIDGKQKENQDD